MKFFIGFVTIAVFGFVFFASKASESKAMVKELREEAKTGTSFFEVIQLHPNIRTLWIQDSQGKTCAVIDSVKGTWKTTLPKTNEEPARSQVFSGLNEALTSQASLLPACPSAVIFFSRIAVFTVILKAEVNPNWTLAKDAQVSASD